MKCPLFRRVISGERNVPEAAIRFYPESAVERTMKIQEAILRSDGERRSLGARRRRSSGSATGI